MAEPWFRCHADLASKKVAHTLARELRIDFVTAVGHLVLLWGWFSRNTYTMPAGSLKNISDEQIEDAARWRGKPHIFASWIRVRHTGKQKKGHINDWEDYNGRLESKREQDRTRQANWRSRQQQFEDAVEGRVTPNDVAETNGRVTRDITRDSRPSHVPYDNDDVKELNTGSIDHLSGPSRARGRETHKSTKFSTSARKKTATETFKRIRGAFHDHDD
jgi:hypothetical protein